MIREYHTVMADAIEMIDSKRLEWDQKMYGGKAKDLSGYYNNQFFSEKYDPAKIYKVHIKHAECMVLWLDMMSHKRL